MEHLNQEHEKRIAAYTWAGLLTSVAEGYRTLEEIEAMYNEWFKEYPHPVE